MFTGVNVGPVRIVAFIRSASIGVILTIIKEHRGRDDPSPRRLSHRHSHRFPTRQWVCPSKMSIQRRLLCLRYSFVRSSSQCARALGEQLNRGFQCSRILKKKYNGMMLFVLCASDREPLPFLMRTTMDFHRRSPLVYVHSCAKPTASLANFTRASLHGLAEAKKEFCRYPGAWNALALAAHSYYEMWARGMKFSRTCILLRAFTGGLHLLGVQ